MSSVVADPTPPGPLEERAPAARGPDRAPRNWILRAGVGILGTIVVLAVLAPVITSHDPIEQHLDQAFLPPSSEHWLGTDQFGRDLGTRILYGARTDLRIATLALVTPFVLGTALGLLAGYAGGVTDTVIMRITDVLIAFPFFVLIIALVFVLGAGESSFYVAIATVGWVSYARIVRGQVLVEKQKDYVLAARTAGLPSWRVLARHILPNVIAQPIVFAMSDLVFIILAMVTLGFFGLGVPPPTAEWGAMIQEGYQHMLTHWELSTIPGVAVVLVGLSLSMIGDGIADRLRT